VSRRVHRPPSTVYSPLPIVHGHSIYKLLLIAVVYGLSSIVLSCNSPYTPKPKGYYTIDFPKREYQIFNQPGYPYTFEYPLYANVVKDSTFFGDANENPWWININFPQFNGRIYVSYNEIGGKAVFKVKRGGGYTDSIGINSFQKLIENSYSLTYKHSVKASSIDDSIMTTANNIHGTFFKVGGDAATANQFFLTDSVKHFLRGALYFDATPNEDSLGIVNQFLLQDMKHLVNTFKWKQNNSK